MPETLPTLYVKTGCPWCDEVIDFLSEQKLDYVQKNVTHDPAAAAEMKERSGQTKAPVLDWHGQVLSDFGVAELRPFLSRVQAKWKG